VNTGTDTHPIDRPTTPGIYEAAAFPVDAGYLAVLVSARSDWAEYDQLTGEVEYRIADPDAYARRHGPFRLLATA
jgi:hypothetical protein